MPQEPEKSDSPGKTARGDETGKEGEAECLPPEQPEESPAEDEKDLLIAQLRQDLASTRSHLQLLIEARSARNQVRASELASAHQESQSVNEELRSTVEELRRANEELRQRNRALFERGNDLPNLLNSVNLPLLMVNSKLQIRHFTPPMQRLLHVGPSDIGRSIAELRLGLSIKKIEPVLNEVLETLGSRDLEVQDREGRWHVLHVRPYRTAENKIDGLVVVLMDIDQPRRMQQSLMEARDFARAVLESVPVPIVVLNMDYSVHRMNTSFCGLTETPAQELEGCSLPDLAHRLWGFGTLQQALAPLLKSPAGTVLEFAMTRITPRQSLLFTAQALSMGGTQVLLLMMEDVTLRLDAERLIAQQKKVLERTQDELRNLTGHLFSIQEEERQRVARELHDDVAQRLSLLEILLHEIDPEAAGEAAGKLETALRKISELNTDVRQISHRLHPAILSDLGLPAALRGLVQEFAEHENMPATYLSHELPESWSPEAATAIYRIAQEALRNVAKHAGKTHVKVSLSGKEGQLQLTVVDFGIGFDQEAAIPSPGLGMISMQERARLAGGTLTVQSTLGQGTTVTAEIPGGRHA